MQLTRLPPCSSKAATIIPSCRQHCAPQPLQRRGRTAHLHRRPCNCAASSSEESAAQEPAQPSEPPAASTSATDVGNEMPDALKGLRITEEGLLVDEKTGKEINDFGATRFDVAVRAMRGELDPPAWQENTERQHGIILQSLMQFPTDYMFQVVGMPSLRPNCSNQQFVSDMVSVVESVCQEQLPSSSVEVTERLGGKYVSLKLTCRVRAPELVSMVFDRLEGDERVKMKY